jgi:hypothetical protein
MHERSGNAVLQSGNYRISVRGVERTTSDAAVGAMRTPLADVVQIGQALTKVLSGARLQRRPFIRLVCGDMRNTALAAIPST